LLSSVVNAVSPITINCYALTCVYTVIVSAVI